MKTILAPNSAALSRTVLKPVTLAAICSLLALAVASLQATPNLNPAVSPINSKPYGKSYGEWGSAWWQWVCSIPADQNPLLDTTGDNSDAGQNEDSPVWFLAGNFGGSYVRNITVPEGKALFFPIINIMYLGFPCDSRNLPGCESDQALEQANDIKTLMSFISGAIDGATLSCEIDGRSLQNIAGYREQSASIFAVTLPDTNIFGLPGGPYHPCVQTGYFLMINPLSKGQHVLHFKGETADHGLLVELTYNINVGQGPRLASPNSSAYGKSLTGWLESYWRWYYTGADPQHSKVQRVQFMSLPSEQQISGSGTPADPALLRGNLAVTLPSETPFLMPLFAWVWERYNNGTPDDVPMDNAVALGTAHPTLTIDGQTVLSDGNKASFFVPDTAFDPIVVYPQPSSYGSIAALSFQSVGVMVRPLSEGTHVIHLYEPMIIPAGAYVGLPAGLGLIYDNSWTVTVTNPHNPGVPTAQN
jgi:hypothetical protein